jgi:hypothetical protein
MIRRNLVEIALLTLIGVGLYFMYVISMHYGKLDTKQKTMIKQKDATIALYKTQLDSLTNYNDSISQELDGCQHEIARYVYSVDYLTLQNPKAADQFIQHFLQDTE